MDAATDLIDDAVAIFRRQLLDVLEDMKMALTPDEFTEAERRLVALAKELAAEMTRRVLQEVSDNKARGKAALAHVRKRAGRRGIQLLVERRRETLIRTLGGQEIRVKTPYARAKPRGGKRETRGPQGTGVYPVLDQLGIAGRSTPALRLLVGRAVCEASSVTAARELLEASGVDIDHKGALRLTYMVCDDALRAREEAVEATTAGNPDGPFAGRRVVAAIDGGRINIRRRVAGRPRKGGRKHFETEWREPKVLTIYVLDDDGKRDRTIDSVIDGTLGDADAAFELLTYHLRRLGAHRAQDLTLIGDGADWIWNRADALRESLGLSKERFREIVDYFHVVERLAEDSHALGYGEEARIAWLHTMKQFVKAGKIEKVEQALRVLERNEPDRAKRRQYLENHRERMRYAAFREQGLPIGSGAVESAVRRVVNLRMKGASVFWTEEHAEGILHLRAHAKSGRWDELESAVLRTTGWRPTARQVNNAA